MGDSLWDFAPWGGVGKAPYGILPPGVGLERLPIGFCPLGSGWGGCLWDFAPWGRVGEALYGRLPMGFCPLA